MGELTSSNDLQADEVRPLALAKFDAENWRRESPSSGRDALAAFGRMTCG
jgi:hypothetical protein